MKRIVLFFILLLPEVTFTQALFNNQPAKLSQCMTPEQKAAFDATIRAKKALYKSTHKTNDSQPARLQRVLFSWPMKATGDYDFMYNYFNFENFVDQDSDIDTDGDDDNREDWSIEDYECNNRTYDQHRGQDINLWPFWWRMMDKNYVMAVAAAPGVILSKDDGHYDKNCSCIEPPNIVSILHDDGSVSSYWHLKKNTLTAKAANQRVEAGEFLGFIGSSGCSSWPHLHFEVHDENDNVIEPFIGNCNTMNTNTWWQSQRPYWDPQIARLMTHSAIPSIAKCSTDEVANVKNQFSSSDIVFTGIAFMDGQKNDQASCALIRPNGTVYQSWTTTLSETESRHYATNLSILPSGNVGTWTFRVNYRNRTYVHFFSVGCKATETLSGSINGNAGFIAGDFISSTAVHTAGSTDRVLYQANNYIEFKPGAEIRAGTHFKARIKDCNYSE